MRTTIAFLVLAALAPAAWSADATAGKSAPDPDQAVAAFRADLMAKSSDVMAKGLTLTSEQAAKFWPLFEQFQKEQSAIFDEQIKATRQYADHLGNLSDTDALSYINALLKQDAQMNGLRTKWLTKFQSVVPARVAARAIQLDRRLGHVTQVGLSSQIPLIH